MWANNRLMPKQYAPPFAVNATILARVAQISELLRRWSARTGIKPSPTMLAGVPPHPTLRAT